jgi:hypothetical protein
VFDTLFKNKEVRMQERAEKEELSRAASQILTMTTHTIPQPYEVIGTVSSNLYDGSTPFQTFMDELKKEALSIGGDAVIGITFQTVGIPTEYKALRNANKYDNHYHMYSDVKSRAVGTVVRFTTN